MIAASQLSPDEYAMRIATQIESALICKVYSSPFIVSPIPVFPAPQRTPSPMGRRYRCTPYRASCKQTTTVQSSGHGKMRYRSSSRLCRVSSDFSRCLPPVSSGLILIFSRSKYVTKQVFEKGVAIRVRPISVSLKMIEQLELTYCIGFCQNH
ncbi:hypothetical protein TNCV_4436341 [Trichonephila clavipes]|nr:hypothetical protein TNCV_4436341 [Trichonephila clavipes]